MATVTANYVDFELTRSKYFKYSHNKLDTDDTLGNDTKLNEELFATDTGWCKLHFTLEDTNPA